jgi:hypothetical protein
MLQTTQCGPRISSTCKIGSTLCDRGICAVTRSITCCNLLRKHCQKSLSDFSISVLVRLDSTSQQFLIKIAVATLDDVATLRRYIQSKSDKDDYNLPPCDLVNVVPSLDM